MIKIFNKQAITRKQRFSRAILVGSVSTVVILAVLILLYEFYGLILSDIFYLAFGFAIGYIICEYGRGVQLQFSILAAGLTLALIVVYDLVTFGSIGNWLAYLLTADLSSLWAIGYRVGAVVIAFMKARIVK